MNQSLNQFPGLTGFWKGFLTWGIIVFILGLLAISASTFTTMLSVVLIGVVIALGGSILLIDTFMSWRSHLSSFLVHLIISLLYLGVGLMLIVNPVLGSASLTLILGVFYILVGISRITYSLSLRVMRWQWSFLNGFVSLLLGILIVTNLSSASLFIIGLIVGIDLLFCGLTYIVMALTARKLGG
jgi:uncharacterized membrane protein HdeD (DUF308 family)